MRTYVVMLYTAGETSRPITVPVSMKRASGIALRCNEECSNPQVQHFYVEKVK